jgi:hypothetical protein
MLADMTTDTTEPGDITRPPGLRLLAILIGLGILSTAIHYAHNFAMADRFPPIWFIDTAAYQIGIAVFWPLCTASALRGYWLYAHGRNRQAQLALYGYVPLGMTTPLHFLGGTPDIPAFFMVTVFTDFLTALSVLLFALWIGRDRNRAATAR